MTDLTNDQHADNGFLAIEANAQARGDQLDPDRRYVGVTDLLADVLHFCKLHDIDFDLKLQAARLIFDAELADTVTTLTHTNQPQT